MTSSTRHAAAALLAWAATIALLIPVGASRAETIDTPEKVWADFDPRREPLDIESLKQWSEGSTRYHEFFFRGETYQDQPVRVYALYAAPEGGKNLPGILHIHGGGQTASMNWLKFWTARGYAALSFDYCGTFGNHARHTDWGKLVQGNMGNKTGKLHATGPSVRESSWYHWALVARRALTVLERQDEVDPERLGVFGVSTGGSLVWTVAATDKRVKAACPIYGVGWNTHPRSRYALDPKKNDPETLLWRHTMEPDVYASLMDRPVLLLNATNDHHGKMDWSYETLAALRGPWRVAFTPRYRHHIAEEQGHDLPLFMDTHLKQGPAWPETPVLNLDLDESGVPRASLMPDRSQPISKVEIFYAVRNVDPVTRYWRSTDVETRGDTWMTSLPILDPSDRLFAFASITYDSGICLSSNFQAVIPSELGPARATDRPSLQIGDFRHGTDGFATNSPGTDPVQFVRVLEMVTGPQGVPGLHVLRRARPHTAKLSDPKWRGPDGAKLGFLVQTGRPIELVVTLHEHEFSPAARQYKHAVKLGASPDWQPVALAAGEFKTSDGHTLAGWGALDVLEFDQTGPHSSGPTFADVRWIIP
jgi:dienelactone hydrolase